MIVGGIASALVLGTAFLGYTAVSAQESPDNSIFSKVAQILSIKEEDLSNAFKQAQIEKINERVAAGELDETQAKSMIERITSSDGFWRFGRDFGLRGNMKLGMINIMEILGIDKEEAMKYRDEGKTLVQIAEEKGISKEKLESLIVEEIKNTADKDLEEGKITSKQKENIYTNAEEKAQAIIDHQLKEESGQRHFNENWDR